MKYYCVLSLFLLYILGSKAQIGIQVFANQNTNDISNLINYTSNNLPDAFNLGIQLTALSKIKLSRQIKISPELTVLKSIHTNSGEISNKKWTQSYIYNWIVVSSHLELLVIDGFYVLGGVNYNYLLSNRYKWEWSDQSASLPLELDELNFNSRTNITSTLGIGYIIKKRITLECRYENYVTSGELKSITFNINKFKIGAGIGILF